MKKIFTLAMAVAAVLTAGADEVNLVSSDYITATYTRYPSNTSTPYEMTVPSSNIEIVADPEVENGYIIKHLCENMFFSDERPGNVNDLKATFNPETNVLSIAPGQMLMTYDFEGDIGVREIFLMAIDTENRYNENIPIEFTYSYGRLMLNTKTTQAMSFMQTTGDPTNPYFGVSFVVFDYIAYVPNGTMTYFDMGKGEETECPILGLNVDGMNYIYNFGGCDRFHGVPFVRRGNEVYTTGDTPSAQVILKNPTLDPSFDVKEIFYLCAIDEDNNPLVAIVDGKEKYVITGELAVDESDECVIALPACALFNTNDRAWAYYDEVEITYNPSQIAGIGNVAAEVDNTNAPVVYYNLQGMRVNNPENGIFIRQQGTESTKVLVK